MIFGQMSSLPRAFYTGNKFANSSPVLIPKDKRDSAAVAAFIFSDQFLNDLRSINQKVSVDNGYITKVPFDAAFWQQVAIKQFPSGLPEPYSDDPTQWLFHGHPLKTDSGIAIHIALVRLAGYHWPAENDPKMPLEGKARGWIDKVKTLPRPDDDGILCVPAVAGHRPLADRLRAFLVAAFGSDWSDTKERQLIAEADEQLDKKAAKDQTLEGWLRDRAFRQHCRLFNDRPFLWQVWDGMKDGFSAFLHYHRLDQATLRKLAFTVLNDWLARAKAEGSVPRQEKGRELQQTLERILEGESPYDIFVRWKPAECQPLGWDPDLDDGVRLNIRPFVKAGILRDSPNVKWTKDRGTDAASAPWYPVHGGERINDHHTTLAEKRAARGERG
jgi:hypothetical protein